MTIYYYDITDQFFFFNHYYYMACLRKEFSMELIVSKSFYYGFKSWTKEICHNVIQLYYYYCLNNCISASVLFECVASIWNTMKSKWYADIVIMSVTTITNYRKRREGLRNLDDRKWILVTILKMYKIKRNYSEITK